MNARRAAYEVLSALDTGPQRLEKLIHQIMEHVAQDRDRAQAVSLVYAVLRNQLYLDHLLAAFASRPLKKMDPPVLRVLRTGAADVVLMRTPDHAAVHAAVELARATEATRAGGMVNAVLRALARGWQGVALPEMARGQQAALAVKYSHPPWLVGEMLAAYGVEQVEPWLAANQQEPPLALRVNTLKTDFEEVAELLASHAQSIEPHPLSAESMLLTGVKGRPMELPGFSQGKWQMQDPAGTAVSTLLGVSPGMRVLDMCAGTGGKTGHLAQLMQNQGKLWAVDTSPGRVKALHQNLGRLGTKGVTIRQADALELDPEHKFDAILIDAPCTGLGTCGRRPDVRWRRTLQDAHHLSKLQLKLCQKAAELLKPGGAMLYVTCTITRAENQGVIERLLAAQPGLSIQWDPQAGSQAQAAIGEDDCFCTQPHRHGSDAFFAVRLVKK